MRIDFNKIRRAVTPEDLTARYYDTPNRVNFIRCPFHNDDNASMRVGGRNHPSHFKCMGECAWYGDVVDFTQKFFKTSRIEAIEKLNNDFAIGLDLAPPSKQELAKRAAKRAEEQRYQRWRVKYLDKTIPDYTHTVTSLQALLKKLYINPETPDKPKSDKPTAYLSAYINNSTGNIDFINSKSKVPIYETEEITLLADNIGTRHKKNFKINPLRITPEQELDVFNFMKHKRRLEEIREQIPAEFDLKLIYNNLKKKR